MASRMEELLDVLLVPPGKKIDLKKDYDPGFTGKWMKKEEAEETAGRRHPTAGRDAGQALRPGHVCAADRPAGAGCGRQGRHDQARHVGRQPAGRAGLQLQGARPPRSWTTTTCGATSRPCPSAGTSASSTVPTTKKSWSCACTPRFLAGQKLPSGAEGQGHLEAALRGDQQLREVPGAQRHRGRQVLPERLQGGAEGALPGARSTAGEELEVLRGRREGARLAGTSIMAAYEDMFNHTSTEWAPWYIVPADTSGSRGWPWPRCSTTR